MGEKIRLFQSTMLFDTSDWGELCDVTVTVKQARKSDDDDCMRPIQSDV